MISRISIPDEDATSKIRNVIDDKSFDPQLTSEKTDLFDIKEFSNSLQNFLTTTEIHFFRYEDLRNFYINSQLFISLVSSWYFVWSRVNLPRDKWVLTEE